MLQKVYEYKNNISIKKNKVKNLPSFLNRMSTLLEEGYTFFESIQMLLPYHVKNNDYWYTVTHEILRNGENVVEVFKRFSVPEQFLITIKIADENGELAKALKMISNQMEFQEKLRKQLSKLLIYPVFLLLFLVAIFVGFRTYFMPNIEQIINSRMQGNSSNFTGFNFLLYFPDIIIICLIFAMILFFLSFSIIKKLPVQHQMKILQSIPINNYFFKLHLTKQFSRLVGSLLVGGFSLQQSLEILKEQQLNRYLKFLAFQIESKIIYGDSLSNAVLMTEYFFPKFEEFIKHGEKSGYLGREMIIYSDLLEERLQSLLKTGISLVQPIFFIIIAVSIIAAYMSILLPMYNIIEII